MLRLLLLLLIIVSSGCRLDFLSDWLGEAKEADPVVSGGETPVSTVPRSTRGQLAAAHPIPLLDELKYCEIRHRGLFLDLGSDSSESHRSYQPGPFTDIAFQKRAGNSTGAVQAHKLHYDFWLEKPAEGIHVQIRAQGEGAARMALYIDGKRVGGVRLPSRASKVFDFGPVSQPLEEGRHSLQLSFSQRRDSAQPYALVDWARIFLPDGIESQYAPPTRRALIHDVVIAERPRKAIALRAPGSVRCAVIPNPGTRLKLDLGHWGQGTGTARVTALLGGGQSVVLAEEDVDGTGDAKWLPQILDLSGLAGRLVVLEFEAVRTEGSGRVVFGEPTLHGAAADVPEWSPKHTLLIVNSGLSRRFIPPWGDRAKLPHLFSLVQQSVTFEGYRISSTLSSAILTTLLSGQGPLQHQVTDLGAQVPERLPLISDHLRKAGIHTAFFTNVPYSFEPFGFNRAWETFAMSSPVGNDPGSAPLLKAKQWLEKRIESDPDGRTFVALHLIGGHPPWDVTTTEAGILEPPDYQGVIEPRRGAIVLREVRTRTQSARRKLGPNDWLRMQQLQLTALGKQDSALGNLIHLLEHRGQLDDALIVWMGDVGMGDPPDVPFQPQGDLSEGHLHPPLFVKFPEAWRGGGRNGDPVTTETVARSLFAAFRAALPEGKDGPTLTGAAVGAGAPVARGILSRSGTDYALFVGTYRLHGAAGRAPTLCDLAVDPSCQVDLALTQPRLMEWLWRLALQRFDQDATVPEDLERTPAPLDDATRSALSVFGL